MVNENATYYTKDIMEQVKSANNIVDVISECIPVKRYGLDIVGQCPFHEGEDFALLISDKKQVYQCADCDASGDVYSFVMNFKHISLREATEYLAARAGITLPDPHESITGRKERETTLAINKEAAQFYFRNLTNKQDLTGLDYLHQRGLNDQIIMRFGIGYATPRSDDLYQHLKEKGFTDKQLEKSGLISFYKNSAHDKFRSRVMCPIVDTDKNVVGFSGRLVGSEQPKQKGNEQPKYKNSPATLPFDKKTVLYGLNLAKKTQRHEMILCEGNLDVIAMHQAGFDNAVASLGTALSKEHANILSQYTDSVHLIYDSDAPGIKATLRALPLLREAGIKADVVHLEPYKDPDEFLKAEGAQAFDERLSNAENGYMFEIRIEYGNYDLHDAEQTHQMLVEFGGSLISKPEEIKSAYIDAMKAYIEHYDEILANNYYLPARTTASDTGISVVREEAETPESPIDTDATKESKNDRGEEKSVVDTSWLDDFTVR